MFGSELSNHSHPSEQPLVVLCQVVAYELSALARSPKNSVHPMTSVSRSLCGTFPACRASHRLALLASSPALVASTPKTNFHLPHAKLSSRATNLATARSLHSSSNHSSPSTPVTLASAVNLQQPPPEQPPPTMAAPSPLAVLPLTNVLRSLMTTTVSSSPLLLPPSLAVMSILANTTQPLLNPDENPLLRLLLKNTFYAQFCAGENAAEVRQTVDSLKRIGFGGVILGYAREVVLTEAQRADLASCASDGAAAEECIQNEIRPWAEGTLQTVRLAEAGDFVALKFTGAGRQALYALSQRQPPTPALASAIDEICRLAASRGVRLLLDAEQQALQPGIDDWSLDLMRRHNRGTPDGRAVVYGTYQAYLKATPATLARHLAAAHAQGFALGVKLVRGAYLGSDPRHLIHDTKADTDRAYDGAAEALLRRRWNDVLVPPAGGDSAGFPAVSVVLATHNRESVLRAQDILSEIKASSAGDAGAAPDVAFAQLQGMADEVSCELVARGRGAGGEGAPPRVYKYLVWGSTGECMKYLLRRAYENRDAVQRTKNGREAMRKEVVRRVKGMLGLSA
ncbi:hypothetical protein VTJ83DRAFT_92 [Remersonia thermophila]|uniref:Proline dehydrogenase n=1 Tax=Remersonia thermophila TaxID=72144 RepID=A0ABR4DK12_9PEZI